jgi:tyrosine-protein kinase Etk/Wzc
VLSLAATLAADGKWVLVIDADLRKPSHHILAGYHEEQGLRGILRGQCEWRDVVKTVAVENGEFFSISAGKMGPTELMSNDRMARFLIEARSRYDFVLIDAPSFPLVADALVLAPSVDSVLSVMRLQKTPRTLAAEHVKRLSRVAHDFGIIVNGAAAQRLYGYDAGNYGVEPPRRSFWSFGTRKSRGRQVELE